MLFRRISLLFALCVLFVASGLYAAADPKTQIRFNRDIRPILAETCFHCHGPDPGSRKAKLRLDREDGFFGDRQDGPTVVRGKPEASPMYQRIVSKDPEEMMPPPKAHHTLKPEEIERVRLWIAQGAQWEPHWSFIKPERPVTQPTKNAKWVRNPIDNYVLAKLDALKLEPAPEADKRTIARRVALDLTGLPPDEALLEAFVADSAPNAYEKLVDKLLESPRYGEHRARYWLDAARYADTHGLHFDNYREMWLYRDWVVNAFNKNQPFDQFTVEQLAGDLLEKPTPEQIVATGFHRCNITTNEGGTIAEENLANYARDRVETTSWVWLGLTANCAVCHDHKFDPITQKDFYSMAAFFRNTTQGALDGNVKDSAPILMMPKLGDEKRWNEIPKEIEAANASVEARKKAMRPDYDKWLESVKVDEWVGEADKAGKPEFHLVLNEEKPAGQLSGTVGANAVVVNSADPLVWEEGGKLGKALVLQGKTPITLASDFGNLDKDKPFSFSCWLKLPKDHKGSGAIFSRMDDGADYVGWDFWVQDKEIGTHIVHKWPNDAIKVVSTGNQLKPGQWQHVAISYDGSSKSDGVKIYVDGKETPMKAEQKELKNPITTTAPFQIGQRKNKDFLKASVQDLRIYLRKLAQGDAARMANGGKLKELLAKAPKDRNQKDKDTFFDIYVSSDKELGAAKEKAAALETEKKTLKDRGTVTHIMEEKKGSMPTANILMRGEYDKPKDKVDANVMGFLHALPPNAPKNRLGLAQWIVAPENPLTPRVIVNRFWQEIFGTGLVKTAEDFGIMGEEPANTELLDYLAVEFREGWNVKKLMKLIVTSATYRQSALTTRDKVEKDPSNRFSSRGPRFRMDAEMIRDYALTASGLLSDKLGGPSVKPYQPDGVWEAVGMREGNTKVYKRDTGDALYRRSMYSFWKRMAPPASMDILNAPSREFSCVRRERTNTPLQALVTLNDPQFIEAARVLAQNALKAGADDAKRLDYVSRRILARPMTTIESAVVLQMQRDLLATYTGKVEDAKALLAVGEIKPDAALEPALLASWTMVCNQMLNLDEALNK